ncbi:MAG: 2-amino-4-hydroxy-6-hydroxymethyldihydropteridine diphosphokinase [Phycisphaerales bacterium]|nr:2-amino-4-hydroxy-6-hydroxymethyldihydropteridine diphosphokinase [Phycisphaerales bacterium]
MADVIHIDRLLARAVIGLNEWERRAKQDVLVSAKLWIDLRRVGYSDRVDDTLNYGTLIRQVLAHVEASERHTVETLATEVAGICLWDPVVGRARIRVAKPAADRFVRSVGVTIERTREELMQEAYIALGSNREGEKNLPAAASRLNSIGEVVRVSGVVQTEAANGRGGDYLNAAAVVRTCLPAAEVRRRLKAIERELGREADSESVKVDLDLSLLGGLVIDAGDVRIPHADVLTRPHVAALLAEVGPEVRHPGTGDTMRAIASGLGGGVIRPRGDVKLTPGGKGSGL